MRFFGMLLAVPAVFLGACDDNYMLARQGVSADLKLTDVSFSADKQASIVRALQRDSGAGDLYSATLYGFNYVDDQCRIYFSELFSAERKLLAAKSGVSAAGQTTNAILSVTGASRLSMAVVAQAFGLTSSLIDVSGSSFLYRLPAAATKEFVSSQQLAYRDALSTRRSRLSEPEVYYHVQRYLDLCLPATIEGRITKYLGTALAVPETPRGSGSGAFDIAIKSAQPVTSRVQIITDATRPIAPVRSSSPNAKNAMTAAERRLTAGDLREIQKALCVTADGDWGGAGSNTRIRIRQYLERNDPDSIDKTNPEHINDSGSSTLRDLVDDKSKKCGEAISPGGGNGN
jgi:hypothetical protein